MASVSNSTNSLVLSTLRNLNSELNTTQMRIGTGKKVNSASDNSTVWALAQGIRSEQSQQDNLSSNLTLVKSRADAGIASIDTAQKIVSQMTDLANGAGATPDYTDITAKFLALQKQLSAALKGADVKGVSYMTDASALTVQIGPDSANTVALTVTDQVAATNMAALLGVTGVAAATATTVKSIADLKTAITDAGTQLTTYRTTLATFSSSIGIQQDFLSTMSSIRNAAVSDLVDADLTEESAKLTALQTQQQLAYQALSIGNSSSQNVLRLFQ